MDNIKPVRKPKPVPSITLISEETPSLRFEIPLSFAMTWKVSHEVFKRIKLWSDERVRIYKPAPETYSAIPA